MQRTLAFFACLCLLAAPVQPVYAVDLSLTAASVVPSSGYTFVDGTAGETITAGQTLYFKDSDSRYWKADSDSATAAVRSLVGIALSGASAGQPIRVQTGGSITIGATVTVGEIYVLSDTAGGIMPEGDLEQGDYVTIVGIATSSTVILLDITNSGVAVP
jgi:hypothetical protein